MTYNNTSFAVHARLCMTELLEFLAFGYSEAGELAIAEADRQLDHMAWSFHKDMPAEKAVYQHMLKMREDIAPIYSRTHI